ncbi:MAG: 1-deoxy-D-xylulose-5-phosphate reductoisomerase [Proteobacteria bacterium]|nr:1-deoxy-D-xylulose-5-phosphate reductoisomerase [Pseudomonadota bacterium]
MAARAERKPGAAPKRVSILGSTGSIGVATVELIERGDFEVVAMTANTNVALLAAQARRLRPQMVVVGDESRFGALKALLSDTGIELAAGPEALVEAGARRADWVMAAIVGAAGLPATLAAVTQGAVVALANKEVLVCAGDLVLAAVANSGATLLPVDSEHNAIFQVFDFDNREAIERIVLTASGGPFRELPLDEMSTVTPAQAIAHPIWNMGPKISVDSATMMNKGLELIEAHYLFGLGEERIEVLVHPESVIHSMVGYADGSMLAQLASPDMRTPIAHTLAWPRRMKAPVPRLDLGAVGRLTFEAPDDARFPALSLARQALRSSGAAPTILNAANEVAVDAFLAGRIGFMDISRTVAGVLAEASFPRPATLDDVLGLDSLARRTARDLLRRG